MLVTQFSQRLIGCNNHLHRRVNFDVRMQFHGRPGCSTSANTIFRLANKFSMRYYQSAVELGAERLCSNQFVSCSDVLILWVKFREHDTDWLLVAACLHLQVYVVLFVRQCDVDFMELLLSGRSLLKVKSEVNASIATQSTANFPSPNCYRYKIAICKRLAGCERRRPKGRGSLACGARATRTMSPISAHSRRLH